MSEIIEFEIAHEYNIFKDGISVETALKYNGEKVLFESKIDTGSTFCIFERNKGEAIGIDIESGIPIEIGTVTGSFPAYGHELTLSVLGIEMVSTVYFAESDYFDRNVLGRIGWLNKVKLGLIEQDGKLFLSEY